MFTKSQPAIKSMKLTQSPELRLDLYLIWEIVRGVLWEFVFTLGELLRSGFTLFIFGQGNKHSAWSNSRENMNPKNNKRVLFNFFKPHLPIKAEQTYPATCERLLSSEFHRKRARFQKGGLMGPNENFTLTEIIKSTPPKHWRFVPLGWCFLGASARRSGEVGAHLKVFSLSLCFVACRFF